MKKSSTLFGWVGTGVVLLFVIFLVYPWLVQLVFAACTNTTNLSLCKPSIAQSGWGTNLNSNFDKIDDVFGTGAAGHDHSGSAGEGPKVGDLSITSQAQGDVLYFNGTSWVRLAAGTSGQSLETRGASANPVWDLPGDLSVTSQAQGDVLYFNGTNWVRLAPGTSGQFLKTQGASANPVWDAAGGVEIARTTGDQAVNASETLVNVTNMSVPLGANQTWAFTAYIRAISVTSATPDIKFAFTVPTGSELSWSCTTKLNTAEAVALCDTITSSGTSQAFGAGTTNRGIVLHGNVLTSSTTGNLQLQFAQNTSTAEDTRVDSRSSLIAWRE